METIYWIQRFGAIHTIAWVFFVLFLVVFIIATICKIVIWVEERDKEDEDYKFASKWSKVGLLIFSIALSIGVFVPSENQLYVIYGVGGTIEYIKENDTAKQLPDKVINALDAWVDKITPKEEEEK